MPFQHDGVHRRDGFHRIANVAFTVPAILVLDRIGRRWLPIPGTVVTAGALVVPGFFFLPLVAGIGESEEELGVAQARGEPP